MLRLYQSFAGAVGWVVILATPVQGAEPPVAVRAQPQVYQSEPQQTALLEVFQSEADPELPWASVALDKALMRQNLTPVVWHVQWRREIGWPDPFAREFSDRRQLALVAKNRDNTRFTPQAFVNGLEWRGLLNGTHPPEQDAVEVGTLKAEIFPSGAINLKFSPGVDFRHQLPDLSAHMVRLVESEDRKIPAGPAAGVHYQASHSVIEHQRADWDERRKHWRFKPTRESLWPEDVPPARLVFWLENRLSPRPIQALAVQVEPKPPPPPIEE